MSENTVRVTLKQIILGESNYISFDADTQPSISGVWDYAQNLALMLNGTLESVIGRPEGDAAAFRIVIVVPF